MSEDISREIFGINQNTWYFSKVLAAHDTLFKLDSLLMLTVIFLI